MKKRVIKKLSLNKKTITTLKTDMLENAKGGAYFTQYVTCIIKVCLNVSIDPDGICGF